MLVQNAINTLFNSDNFKTFISEHGFTVDACHELHAKIKKAQNFWYYEIYLNYHDPTTTSNDMIASVRINENGTFAILNINLI